MSQAADNQTILQNSVNSEIMLARMDERLLNVIDDVKGVKTSVEALKASIDAKKVSWFQAWGPILGTAIALAGIYGTLASDIRELHEIDATSLQQRADMERRINRLELAVIENAK